MEFVFTPEQEDFRQELRQFLQAELPADAGGDGDEETAEAWEFSKQFQKKLAARGWLVPQWPKQYGGADMGILEQLILQEEMAYRGAPIPGSSGIRMLGPVLMLYGTEEQKREHLPGIASGDVIWCQGYSEPGSGSDLASLQTRAVRDGDEYVINGQKIWTSNADLAGRTVLLGRPDPGAPKHRGISFFVFPMKTPGISVQPLINLAGIHGFNQTFYDNVRVPVKSLVGEENRGWYVGAALLDFERSNISGAAIAKRSLEQLTQYCRETKSNGGSLFSQPLVRNELAELAIETEVGRLLSYRVASIQARGQIPNKEASMAKLYHSELAQRLAGTGVQIMGLYGQVRPESPRWARLRGQFTMRYMTSVSGTIATGTSEIQRNIIATRGLGLPRG